MSNNKYCINCGKLIPANSEFCPYCSTKQPALAPTRVSEHAASKRYCPACGHSIPQYVKFCPHCGAEQPTTSQTAGNTNPSAAAKMGAQPKAKRPRPQRRSHFWRNFIIIVVILLLGMIAYFSYQNLVAKRYNSGPKAAQGVEKVIIKLEQPKNQNDNSNSAENNGQSGTNVKWNPSSQNIDVTVPNSSPITKSVDANSPTVWNGVVSGLQGVSKVISTGSSNDDYSNIKVVRTSDNRLLLQVDKGQVLYNIRK
ncbi:zinc-ribbon domain-containing protein [Fructilactobacillus florum]|uniref:zinc ribbon domain-containing protein n=1 Tax=Fructilactobacillus florum TaxID=640331 RepID=UPI00028EFD71|nr:zinc-ribbon domain-containing protein [Fructilactobacillus florum]EKK20076.1 hypothetical protein B807_1148 [Fructilactobacillus florum 2F]